MTTADIQLNKLSAHTEESNLHGLLTSKQLSSVAGEMACFYRTLLEISNRNRARRRIDVPKVL